MYRKIAGAALAAVVALSVVLGGLTTRADEFSKQDLERWQNEYMSVVKKGRELWTSPDLGTNGVACAQCHSQVTPSHERACDTITSPVDCSTCHAETVGKYQRSIHGTLAAAGDADAPVCLDCHSKHATEDDALPSSPTYPRNVPELCAKCHL